MPCSNNFFLLFSLYTHAEVFLFFFFTGQLLLLLLLLPFMTIRTRFLQHDTFWSFICLVFLWLFFCFLYHSSICFFFLFCSRCCRYLSEALNLVLLFFSFCSMSRCKDCFTLFFFVLLSSNMWQYAFHILHVFFCMKFVCVRMSVWLGVFFACNLSVGGRTNSFYTR